MLQTVCFLTLVVKGEGVLDHGNGTASVNPQSMGVCVEIQSLNTELEERPFDGKLLNVSSLTNGDVIWS